MTGGRLKRLEKYINKDEDFYLPMEMASLMLTLKSF